MGGVSLLSFFCFVIVKHSVSLVGFSPWHVYFLRRVLLVWSVRFFFLLCFCSVSLRFSRLSLVNASLLILFASTNQ